MKGLFGTSDHPRHRRSGALALILGMILGTISACESGGPTEKTPSALTVPQQLAAQALAPSYQQWVTASNDLQAQTRKLCAHQSSIAAVRDAWRNDALAWSRLQSMQPGPVTPVSVRVTYWPDKKDLVGHQVGQWLNQSAPSASQLADMSVTLQGLSALEFLLFDPRFQWADASEKARLCPHVSVIAERQNMLSQQALSDWEREQGAGMRSALPNARYASDTEALAELLKANVSGLEVAHKKLVAALGEKYPQPYLAEYWRSGLSLPSARAVLEGSDTLWRSGLATQVEKTDPALAERITALYLALLEEPLLAAYKPDAVTLTALLNSVQGRELLATLTAKMKSLHLAYARDVSIALQIPLGINAHDGD